MKKNWTVKNVAEVAVVIAFMAVGCAGVIALGMFLWRLWLNVIF